MRVSRNTSGRSASSTIQKGNSIKASKYQAAQKHIKAAIDCLGSDAKNDVLAKESIANLSVVLLDLM